MTIRSICTRSGILPASLALALSASLLPQRTAAQGWQRVVNRGDSPGSAVGGGTGNILYAGLTSGHVFRSDDNGLAWSAVTNGLVDKSGRMLPPKAFVVTPTGRVLRGGDNASWENKIGSPVFRSDNQGALWTEVPLPFASPTRNPGGIGISDLVLHKGAIYFSDLLSEGVWKSADDGLTWTAVGGQLPTAPFVGFAKTYYAVASAGDALLTVTATRGVFRSTDGGATWAQAVNGIPGVADSPLFGGRSWNATDVVGAPDGTAFAVVDSRVYRSRDGGASWAEVGDGVVQGPHPFAPTVIVPTARKVELLGDRVLVSTSDGNPRFFEGTVSGGSWAELPRIADNTDNGSILGQSFPAHNGAIYFAGNKGIHRLDLATAARTNLLPVVSTTPAAPLFANVGGTVTAVARARGTAPFTYEWRLNDAPLAGQTTAALSFTATGTNQSGTLSVVVGNAAGRVTNVLGALTVGLTGPGQPDFSFRPQRSGSVTTFAFGPDGSVFYGGPFASQLEAYTGVRHTTADGEIDPAFVTGAVIGIGSGPGLSVGTPSALFPLGDGSVLVGATGAYHRRLLPSGAIDATWPWPAEVAGGPRKITRLADGKFLIAGGSVGGIRRLNADGTFDPTFQGPASIGRFQANYVSDFALLPSGHILIAGDFSEVALVTRVGIARLLPNGALDRSWVPAQFPFNSTTINALAVQSDGKILLGGKFASVGNQPRRGLARLNTDGSLDPSLGDIMPNISPVPVVNAIAVQPDGKFWVGGNFFAFAGRNYLVRLNADGTLDTGMPDIGLDSFDRGTVNALTLTADGRLWIGMPSAVIRGQTIGQLFRIFTDITGPALGYAGFDQTPDAGTSVTLRGTVTSPSTAVQWRFNGTPIAGATALTLPLNNVTLANSGGYDLVVTSAGGTHTSAPANVRVRGPVVLDRPPAPIVGVVSNSVTFSVSAFGTLPLAYQWSRDGTALANATNRTLTLTNLQFSIAADYSVKVTGGDNSTATSEPAFLAVIPQPGAADPAFRLGLFRPPNGGNTELNDLQLLPDGRALVGGTFATVTNGPLVMLARLLPDGSADPAFSFDPSGLNSFDELALQSDGRIIIRVRSSAGGGPYLVRRLDADGSPDPTFPEPGLTTASAITVAPDDSIIVTHPAGLARLSPNGAPDAGFASRAKFDSAPGSISIDPAGRIYASGFFNTVGGQPRRQLARLLADGSLDATFAPTNAINAAVTALADGVFGLTANGFTRFDNAGRADPAYAWTSSFAVMALTDAGGLVGVFGDGVILDPDGTDASPVSRMKVPASNYGYRRLRIGADGALWLLLGSGSGFTEPVSLLFKLNGTITPLALVTHPVSQTVDAGTKVTLTAAATGTSKVAYQWQRNSADLIGETNATFVLGNAQPAANGDYTVVVRNRSGSQTSRVATLVVLAAPEILVPPAAVELGLHDTLRLAVTARGVAPLTYQWRLNGVALPGATFTSHTNRAVVLGDAGTYDVVVSNARGSATSAQATVSVVARPGAVIRSFSPNAGSRLGVTELNVLPNGLYLSAGGGYDRFGELQFFLPYPDGGSTVVRDRVAVDANAGRIYMGPTHRVRAFELNGTIVDSYAGPNANVRLVRVEAAGTVLQWTESSLALQRLGTDGALAAGFTPPSTRGVDALPLPDGKILLLSATQGVLQGNFVFATEVVRLRSDGTLDPTFKPSTNVFRLEARAERLALDRQGRFFVLGGFETYNGQPRSRLARFLADGTLDPSFGPAVINGPVSELAEQVNGKLVIVGSFTQVDGLPRSRVARLDADGSHDAGFDPGTGLTLTGGNASAYDVALLPAGEIIVAGNFDQADGRPRDGCVLLTGDTPDLYFGRQPVDVELLLGGTGELVAEAIGSSAVAYQWSKDGTPLAGEIRPALRLANAGAATIGNYRVVARNASGELASLTARVEVVLPPVITTPPGSVVINVGQNAAFAVSASGRRLAYQWRRAGTNLPAATNSTLVISNATSAARYSVVVSNPSGMVPSAEALLRIRPAVATGGDISVEKFLGRHSFEGSLHEDTVRYGGGAVGAPTFVDGHEGSAVRITTGKNFVQLGLLPLTTQPYTAAFWIRPETTGSLNVFSLTVRNTSFGDVDHYLYLGGDDTTVGGNRVFFGVRGINTVVSADNRAFVPDLVGKWTHFTVIYRGGIPNVANCSVFVDGEELTLANSATLVQLVTAQNASQTTSFGRYGGGLLGANSVFLLDDFRLYNRPLEVAEVLRLARPVAAAPLPQINRQPAGGNADPGGSFTFSIDAAGTDLFYEWYRGTNVLAAADGPALTLSGLTAADAGDYRVVVSNSGGSTHSLVATLTVSVAADPFSAWAAAAGLSGAAADPAADPDLDGAVNLAEFAYGTSPVKAGETPVFAVSEVIVGGTSYPAVTWTRRKDLGQARIELSVASSVDLADELGSTPLSVTPLAGGLERVVTRSDAAQAAKTAQFFRFTVRR